MEQKMTERAQQIMKAYEAEDTYNYPQDGIAAAIRVISSNIHRSGVLEDEPWLLHIADELNEISNELEALK
jgi:hypothetical protein